MYKIIQNKKINFNLYEMIIENRFVAEKALPGQFVMLMSKEDSEKIPISIYDTDKKNGLIYLIYQVVGASTLELSHNNDEIYSITGPLGNPNEICMNIDEYKNKRIVYVAGGVGIAPVYMQVKYLKEHGINVDIIYGARNKELLLLKDKIEKISNVIYTTDDGSYGIEGFVTTALENSINNYDVCVSIGPLIMMKNVCELTLKYNLKTIVSLNPIMIDGSGMCGACRCKIDGKTKFACIDGPEFDGHKVNFESLIRRMNTYKEEEKVKYDEMKKNLGEKYE